MYTIKWVNQSTIHYVHKTLGHKYKKENKMSRLKDSFNEEDLSGSTPQNSSNPIADLHQQMEFLKNYFKE